MRQHIVVSLVPYITAEMKTKDPDWWDHLKIGDTFHDENPVACGVCGCESDYYGIGSWMGYPKLHLICPGHKANVDLHEKIDRKKEFLYKDELPASVLEELALEVMQLKSRIRAQAAAQAT